MAQGRFQRFDANHQVHIVVEGQMDHMGKGGEDQFDDLLFKYKPELVIVDILAKLKRHNTGHYNAKYQAMTEIKELIDKHETALFQRTQASPQLTTAMIHLIKLLAPQLCKAFLTT